MSNDNDAKIPLDANYRRVPPEHYSRSQNPSLKDLHEFLKWLRESTIAELEGIAFDTHSIKSVFVSYFERGRQAGVSLKELVENLGTILVRLDWPYEQKKIAIELVKGFTEEQLKAKPESSGR